MKSDILLLVRLQVFVGAAQIKNRLCLISLTLKSEHFLQACKVTINNTHHTPQPTSYPALFFIGAMTRIWFDQQADVV